MQNDNFITAVQETLKKEFENTLEKRLPRPISFFAMEGPHELRAHQSAQMSKQFILA